MKNAIYRQREAGVALSEIGQEILANARNELYLNLRYLDGALSALSFLPEENIAPMGTDGRILAFDPEAVAGMFRGDRRLINRIYLHSVFHCLFGHLYGFRDSEEREPLWHLACDITAEFLLDELTLPCVHQSRSALRLELWQALRRELEVVTAQGVYRLLTKEPSGGPFEGRDLAVLQAEFYRDDHRLWKRPTRQQKQELKRQWEELRERMQTEMETFSKEAASDARTLQDTLRVVNRKKYDYRDFLRRFSVLREELHVDPDSFDYIFYHYGMELYGNLPLIEPLETREVHRVEEFVIVLDTSMSCSGELIRAFLTETWSILSQQNSFSRKVHIRLIQCDDRVQRDTRITSTEELLSYMKDFQIAGMGGTDFRPAFAYVNGLVAEGSFHRLRGLIYFTDGYGTFPVKKPLYETAFVFMKQDYRDVDVPPWAMKVILDPGELEKGAGLQPVMISEERVRGEGKV